MPYARLELHLRWHERVVVWEDNVDYVGAASVGGVGGALEPAAEVRDVFVVDYFGVHARRIVFRHVVELFHDAAAGGHGVGVYVVWVCVLRSREGWREGLM